MHPFRWLYRVVNSEPECAYALGRHYTTVITSRIGRSKSGCRWLLRIATVVAFSPLLGMLPHRVNAGGSAFVRLNQLGYVSGTIAPP